jgi:hypothetical protein
MNEGFFLEGGGRGYEWGVVHGTHFCGEIGFFCCSTFTCIFLTVLHLLNKTMKIFTIALFLIALLHIFNAKLMGVCTVVFYIKINMPTPVALLVIAIRLIVNYKFKTNTLCFTFCKKMILINVTHLLKRNHDV